jgi:predicted PP-loop superfamily ATPase
MKTVKISEFNWNVNCPYCGEFVDTQDIDITDGEILKCGACNELVKIKVVKSIKEAEKLL